MDEIPVGWGAEQLLVEAQGFPLGFWEGEEGFPEAQGCVPLGGEVQAEGLFDEPAPGPMEAPEPRAFSEEGRGTKVIEGDPGKALIGWGPARGKGSTCAFAGLFEKGKELLPE